LEEIEIDGVPLYQQKQERLNELYPDKNYTVDEEDLKISEDVIPDFSVILPTPKEEDGYYWHIDNWGCKWNASESNVYLDDDDLHINFTTPWGPPKKWLITTAKYYPELTFEIEYDEPGCDFWGKIVYSKGEIIGEEENSLSGHLLECPAIPETIQKIKNLPFENNFPISDYIALFNFISYDNDEYVEIEEIADNLADEYEDITENHTNIMQQIASIWIEMVDSEDILYHDLRSMFHHFVEEILEHYKKIQKIIHYICVKRMKLRISKIAKRNLINKQMIDFAYLPENPDNTGTVLERGGYLYREAKERFENISI
jgi:transcription termination factor NusB